MSAKYTKDILEPIINNSSTWSEVLRALNLKTLGGNYRAIKTHASNYCIDTSHFKNQRRTKKELETIVENSTSWAQVIQKLGLRLTGGNYHNIKKKVKELSLDISHFKGQGWAKGETKKTHKSVNNTAHKLRKYSPEQILVENSPCKNTRSLREALLVHGVPYQCENGHEATWMGLPLTLHIDHVNGVPDDNRPENLRFLCPNCHQQTPTWGSKIR